ncbi:MAG: hypothetical protein ACRD3B_10740, partial [Candidatus Sulfotelmatobacter sp.]
ITPLQNIAQAEKYPAGGLTPASGSGKTEYMLVRWKLRPWQIVVLSIVALAILLIVVIPDNIDLPDTAFHRNTGPTAIHSQATSAPIIVMVASAYQASPAPEPYPSFYQAGDLAASPDPNSVPILLKTIRR